MSKHWTIRKVTKHDIQAISSVTLVSWLDTYVNESLKITREFIMESQMKYLTYDFYLNECRYQYFNNTEDNLYLVAEDSNGIIVGFLHCQRAEGKQLLDGIYLLPELKGSGLAQEFSQRFLNWEDSSMDTELGVVEYNSRAIKFYEKLGFKPNGVSYKVRDRIPCIDMVKQNKNKVKLKEE